MLVAVLVGNALFGLAALIGAEPHVLAMVPLRGMLGVRGTYLPGITWLVRAIRVVGTGADRTITGPPAQGGNRPPAPWFGAWLPGVRLVFWPTLLLGCWRRTYACS
jgi:purine-cytosine permease-like protein